MLNDTSKLVCKSYRTFIDPNHKLRLAEENMPMNKEMYQIIVERLIYLSYTRLDIAYAVSVINQFMYNIREIYLQSAYIILQYLKKDYQGKELY